MLIIIGVAFTVNMRFELRTAEKYNASVKATYLAEAGIAQAIAELKYGPDGAINNAVDTAKEAWYAAESYYKNDIDLGSSWLGEYKVKKIVDCTREININNSQAALILENLISIIGLPLVVGDGNNIVANKPAGGYITKEQIKIVPGIGEDKYNAIKDYITVHGWPDPDVVNPQDVATPYASQPRIPVNVNTASKEVLVALMSGVTAGTSYDYSGVNAGLVSIPPETISTTEADSMATALITYRDTTPFTNWTSFYSFLDNNIDKVGGSGKKRDAIYANCNPNTNFMDLRRINPNYSWRKLAGKTDLSVNTTEFSFNSGGYYEIYVESVVKDARGNIFAEKKLTAVVKIFDIYRETTQAQFENGTMTKVQSYPEAQSSSGPVASIPAANYDGQLMIAAKNASNPSGPPYLLASFTNGRDADIATNTTASGLLTDNSSIALSGEIMPDGAFFRQDDIGSPPDHSYLSYAVTGQIDSDDEPTMTLSFWVKPQWYATDIGDGTGWPARKFWRFHRDMTADDPVGGWSETLFCKEKFIGLPRILGNLPASDDPEVDWKPGEWHHIVLAKVYSDDGDNSNDKEGYYLDGGTTTNSDTFVNHYGVIDSANIDIGWDVSWGWQYPNCTLDEFRISYDYGLSAIAGEFTDGRYYKDGDGERSFISKPKDLGETVEIATMSWTEHLPADYDDGANSVIAGADITLQVKSASTEAGLAAAIWSGEETDPGGFKIDTDNRWVQYKVNFYATPGTTGGYPSLRDTPVLNDVAIIYLPKTEILYWR